VFGVLLFDLIYLFQVLIYLLFIRAELRKDFTRRLSKSLGESFDNLSRVISAFLLLSFLAPLSLILSALPIQNSRVLEHALLLHVRSIYLLLQLISIGLVLINLASQLSLDSLGLLLHFLQTELDLLSLMNNEKIVPFQFTEDSLQLLGSLQRNILLEIFIRNVNQVVLKEKLKFLFPISFSHFRSLGSEEILIHYFIIS